MTSALDLDRFLTDLNLRRERLIRLATPADADLVAEMTELSEQLIVAEDELRVQQEELDSARQAVLRLVKERDRVLREPGRNYVITDVQGVVVHATQAVQLLIRQPPIRLTPRPIATWFEGPDRRVVRAMITRATTTAEPQYGDRLAVRTSDDSRVIVDLSVERMRDSADGRTLLRWYLNPVTSTTTRRDVIDEEHSEAPGRGQRLMVDFGALATVLDTCLSVEQMYPSILEAALRLMPHGGHVGLCLVGARDALRPVAWSSEVAHRLDVTQLEAGRGPLAEALERRAPVLLPNFIVGGYASGGTKESPAMSSALAVPLVSNRRRLGVLTLYAETPGFQHGDVQHAAATLGAHLSTALARADEVTQLQAGMLSRQLIGEAVGVLMERLRLTPEAAFNELRRSSQHSNVKLRDIARLVVETGQYPVEADRR